VGEGIASSVNYIIAGSDEGVPDGDGGGGVPGVLLPE